MHSACVHAGPLQLAEATLDYAGMLFPTLACVLSARLPAGATCAQGALLILCPRPEWWVQSKRPGGAV